LIGWLIDRFSLLLLLLSLLLSLFIVNVYSLTAQDNRDLFGFNRHRRNHSGSSSLGPAAIREELKYIHDDDDVIVKVCCCSSQFSFRILIHLCI